jgi:hypothetical protein
MKKLLLFAFMVGGSVLFCSAQTNGNNSNIVPAKTLQSKKSPAPEANQPSDNSNTLSSDPVVPQTQYLEFKADQGSNTSTTVVSETNDQVTFPIQAEGNTDPNYELNKQKSKETIKQLETPVAAQKTQEELILDLQTKINAIKNGEIVGADATTKLPIYEQELQLLLNAKPTKSCVKE